MKIKSINLLTSFIPGFLIISLSKPFVPKSIIARRTPVSYHVEQ